MRRRRKKDIDFKRSIAEKISAKLELTPDITLGQPKISIVANSELWVENYRGIIEYTPEQVRINTKMFVIKISGTNLKINHITGDDIIVYGRITVIEFGG